MITKLLMSGRARVLARRVELTLQIRAFRVDLDVGEDADPPRYVRIADCGSRGRGETRRGTV
jgi:hypothetical protein